MIRVIRVIREIAVQEGRDLTRARWSTKAEQSPARIIIFSTTLTP